MVASIGIAQKESCAVGEEERRAILHFISRLVVVWKWNTAVFPVITKTVYAHSLNAYAHFSYSIFLIVRSHKTRKITLIFHFF